MARAIKGVNNQQVTETPSSSYRVAQGQKITGVNGSLDKARSRPRTNPVAPRQNWGNVMQRYKQPPIQPPARTQPFPQQPVIQPQPQPVFQPIVQPAPQPVFSGGLSDLSTVPRIQPQVQPQIQPLIQPRIQPFFGSQAPLQNTGTFNPVQNFQASPFGSQNGIYGGLSGMPMNQWTSPFTSNALRRF